MAKRVAVSSGTAVGISILFITPSYHDDVQTLDRAPAENTNFREPPRSRYPSEQCFDGSLFEHLGIPARRIPRFLVLVFVLVINSVSSGAMTSASRSESPLWQLQKNSPNGLLPTKASSEIPRYIANHDGTDSLRLHDIAYNVGGVDPGQPRI